MPKSKAFLLSIFFTILSTISLSAQKELFNLADGFYVKNMYKEAILAYEKALALDPEQPIAIARLAEAYCMTNNLFKAESFYAQALGYNNMQKYIFDYAQVLKSNGNLKEAKKWFQEYSRINVLKSNHFAASCESVQRLTEEKALFTVDNLIEINSKNADFAPFIYTDKLLFSSSRRYALKKNDEIQWTSDAFNQLYMLDLTVVKESRKVQPFREIPGKDINDAPICFSKKGDFVAISANNFSDGIRQIEGSGLMMDIYIFKANSINNWLPESEEFFAHNALVDTEKPYSTGHPCFNQDASVIYFTSNRPGGFGGYDIYLCTKGKTGWSQPKNLGPNINSPGNEMSPFLDESGRLFFSSDWHHGFGGMDIFYSDMFNDGSEWTFAKNVGLPVNSPFDDMYFIYNEKLKKGFFSSNRPGGLGNEDIYQATLIRDFPLAPRPVMKAGDKISLVEVFNSNSIIDASNKELAGFVESLLNQPNLVVQIYAHTDSKGSAQNNLLLSQNQAKAAYDNLISKGIKAERLRYQGMGEQFTVNGCVDGIICKESEHQKNRRVDFIVIGKINEQGTFIKEYDHNYSIVSVASTQVVNPNNPNKSNPENITKVIPPVNNTTVPNNQNTNNQNNTVKNDVPAPKIEASAAPTRLTKKIFYYVGDIMEASIQYRSNSAQVDEKSLVLADLLDIMNSSKHLIIEIGAHTDAVGTPEHNKQLSQLRAEAIRNYLVKKGITADRLLAKGYGETKIKNQCKEGVNCTEAEHAVNRRTEFKILGYKGFKVGDVIPVSEINYRVNSDVIDLNYAKGLPELIHFMKNSEVSVEIRSHTDSRGASDLNLALSERRAKAVYDYLVKNGVSKHRLKYKGYGETMLINRCKDGVNCTNAEHTQNRRTDFKVIGLK